MAPAELVAKARPRPRRMTWIMTSSRPCEDPKTLTSQASSVANRRPTTVRRVLVALTLACLFLAGCYRTSGQPTADGCDCSDEGFMFGSFRLPVMRYCNNECRSRRRDCSGPLATPVGRGPAAPDGGAP